MCKKADADTIAGPVATPIYEVTWSDPDGHEVKKRVEASDARAAAERFRQQGYDVHSALLVSPVQLEHDCPRCGRTNDVQTIRCTSCRATLRGRTIDPAQPIVLPKGYRIQRQADGTLRVDKLGWFWWRRHLAALLILSFMLSGCGSVLLSMAGAPDWAFIVLFVATAAVTLPCFGWALFGSRGWMVTEGELRVWTRLFGRLRTQDYKDAALMLERQISTGYDSGSPSHSSWCILLETLQDYVLICSETTPERGRAIAQFQAQKTGWPLDDRVEGRMNDGI